jgi:la-related protein 1
LFFFLSSEYYFSIENLGADIFLRQQMSKDGYIPLSLIASFNRVQTLCDDINFIAEVYISLKRFSIWEKEFLDFRQ